VTLEKMIELPALPTMGAWLDLRSQGVEAPLEVGWCHIQERRQTSHHTLTSFLACEPLASAELARAGGMAGFPAAVNVQLCLCQTVNLPVA
jgi:hypothetical protein